MTQEDISKIMVENKQRVPVTKHDTAVFIVDIPKASKLILEFVKNKRNGSRMGIRRKGYTNTNCRQV